MIPSRVLSLSALLLLVPVLGSCSSTTNTISGLSTLQSTISGSNYVFFVDPQTGNLTGKVDGLEAGERIRAGDYFAVSLDFGFVRYLQAVDPYVIVYAESWMGNKPRPTDSEKTLRQVVLLKEGMAPNAKLPVTSVPILGPVTMGEDLLNVYVTLKVVVLSKRDNQETIQLVEGLAGQAAAAAPQYSAIAGAAAATVAAFIAQNRDKVEFEHTFAFSPEGFLSESVKTSPYFSHTILREGQIVVIKGESRFRSIPYPNWYYYLYPLNWFGLSPDGASRRFESDAAPEYTPIGEIIRIPASAIGSLFSDARSDASFWRFLFPGVADPPATAPANIALDGYQLVKCMNVVDHDADIGGDPKDETKFSFLKSPPLRRSCKLISIKTDDRNVLDPIKAAVKAAWKFVPVLGAPNIPQPTTNIYSEKTHFIARVHKTKGTLGTFDELLSHFSEHAATINEVTTSASTSRNVSAATRKQAFDSVQGTIKFDGMKQQIRHDAKRGQVGPPDISQSMMNDLDEEDIQTLRMLSVKENVYYTEKRIIHYAREYAYESGAFCKVVDHVHGLRTGPWKAALESEKAAPAMWTSGWRQVLENVYGVLVKYPTKDQQDVYAKSKRRQLTSAGSPIPANETHFKSEFQSSTWRDLMDETKPACPLVKKIVSDKSEETVAK